MYFLYNIFLLIFLLLTSPLWIYKILALEKYRKGLFQKVGILLPDIPRKAPGEVRIHVHAVSVGEVIAATPFIEGLKKRHREISLFISTVTPTGNEVARKRFLEANYILYSPYDLPWAVRRFIEKVQPDLYVTVETELWPNFLRQVKRYGAHTLIVNGRISPRTFKGYYWIRPFMKRVLSNIDLFCMQSEEDAKRIVAIGAPEKVVRVTGNMKYDQSFVDLTEEDRTKKMDLFGIEKGDHVIIAGSTHRGEEELIVRSCKGLLGDHRDERAGSFLLPSRDGDGARDAPSTDDRGGFLVQPLTHTQKTILIIVPRHPERAGEVEAIVRAQGLEPIRRTELNDLGRDYRHPNPVFIVDTIGELAMLYSLATVVIIGGSFIPHGGQNPLEAMYHKKPVIFGPHMFNFREIREEILKSSAGLQVERPEDLAVILTELLKDTKRQKEMGEKGYRIIQKNRGAVERNLDIVEGFLLHPPQRPS